VHAGAFNKGRLHHHLVVQQPDGADAIQEWVDNDFFMPPLSCTEAIIKNIIE
jgi:hypothetical protein